MLNKPRQLSALSPVGRSAEVLVTNLVVARCLTQLQADSLHWVPNRQSLVLQLTKREVYRGAEDFDSECGFKFTFSPVVQQNGQLYVKHADISVCSHAKTEAGSLFVELHETRQRVTEGTLRARFRLGRVIGLEVTWLLADLEEKERRRLSDFNFQVSNLVNSQLRWLALVDNLHCESLFNRRLVRIIQ